jgi:CBS domain-containing protein
MILAFLPGYAMGMSEFDDAYEDEPNEYELEEQQLGEAILGAAIKDLEPRPAAMVKETASIKQAIQLMLERNLGAVLVEREGKPVGIFTERDVLRRVIRTGIDQERPVEEVMTPDPESLSPEDSIAFALNRMAVGGYRNIPIVDDGGQPVALLSQRDVVAYIVSVLPARVLNLPPLPNLEARSTDGG